MTGVRFNFHLNTHENVFGDDNFSWGGGGGEQGIRAFRGRGGGMEKRYVFTKSFKISC